MMGMVNFAPASIRHDSPVLLINSDSVVLAEIQLNFNQ